MTKLELLGFKKLTKDEMRHIKGGGFMCTTYCYDVNDNEICGIDVDFCPDEDTTVLCDLFGGTSGPCAGWVSSHCSCIH